MDGVVVVVERGGALHLARSFSARFDRLHAKSDRMNLAALLFALQSVATDSIRADGSGSDGDAAITLFETATERIVMARSRCRGLLIALFVRPHLDAVVARSLVRRIALLYDLHAVASLSNARVFSQACGHAVQDEADAWLHEYAASLYQGHSQAHSPSAGFVLFHFESPSGFDTAHNGNHVILDADVSASDDDECHDGAMSASSRPGKKPKATRLASPRLTGEAMNPPSRLQKLYASTRSLLPQAKTRQKIKKNAVLNHADPKCFRRCVVIAPRAQADSNDALVTLLGHPQFPHAIVDALRPTVTQLAALASPATTSASAKRVLIDGTWRNFPLPQLSSPTASPRIAVPLRFWIHGGGILVCVDSPQGPSAKARVSALLNRVEPLAKCAVRLSK